MKKKTTIAIINHSFQMEYYARRWQLFAESHPDTEVYLLTPSKYSWYKNKAYTFGKSFDMEGNDIDNKNYHIRTFKIEYVKYLGYKSKDFATIFKDIDVDVIYMIGGHNTYELAQVLNVRDSVVPSAKVIGFSMRGPALTLRIKRDKCNIIKWVARRVLYFKQKQIQDYIYAHIDAFLCHYPDAVTCFKNEGYNGPIYMQTQVGVNKEWFHEDAAYRSEIRNKYGIADSTYVFGSATRFTRDKGVDEILRSLPADGDWKYLMMGSGNDEELQRLKDIIKERNIEDKVIVTGFIDWLDMAQYWNAVDCAIHVPLTTPTWEETFSLAAIQPQIMKKPVIGDTSGSVPYQIGFDEMIVPEGDVSALSQKMQWVLNNKDAARKVGEKMYIRTLNSFEVQHLNDLFYRTIVEDIIPGKYDSSKFDMAN